MNTKHWFEGIYVSMASYTARCATLGVLRIDAHRRTERLDRWLAANIARERIGWPRVAPAAREVLP